MAAVAVVIGFDSDTLRVYFDTLPIPACQWSGKIIRETNATATLGLGLRYGSCGTFRSSPRHGCRRIICRIMQWNLQSNVCDVLSLGPRTAGQLATVGLYTVADLLAAKPSAVTQRLGKGPITATALAEWQGEAQLIIALPELSSQAARLLAAAGLARVEKISQSTPTELLAAIETEAQQNRAGWLAQTNLPTVSEVNSWIRIAGESQKSFAA